MIQFKEIDEANFKAVVDMKQPEGQGFVAPNVYSLAQAWLYRTNEDVFPFAIYNDDELVGFIMLDHDEDEGVLTVWRFMIAPEHQGRGYGTQALKLVINEAKASDKFSRIRLDYVTGNEIGEHVYRKAGFQATGEIDAGEIVMELVF